ncbi:hypothetical protein [uncultured Sphingobacterium sp.]|uniref:hypothetical protein n=1 Tax=uncultured Sphingobacterium sp. TaxID=182688 RepID=UPI0025CD6503|nr:hypothetical protein [uncultured Sphingobacterium sp.]
MGILKKLKRSKSTTIGDISKVILSIDKLKKNRVLKTTDLGYFEIYPDIIEKNEHKQAFCKNLYFYARQTQLIKKGETLDLINIEDNSLIALITAEGTTFLESEQK